MAEYYAYVIQLLRQSLNFAANGFAIASDIDSWLKLCIESIEALQEYILSETLTRAEKQKCQTSMNHLITIRNKLQNLTVIGGEIQEEVNEESVSKLVEWNDVQSAFRNRITSGIISNLGHLDIISFLDEAQILFESKIESILEEYNAIK